MKWTKWLLATLMVLVAVQGVATAREGAKPYQILNRLRLEWDDNIYQEKDDPTDSWKIIKEVEFRVNLNLRDQTFISLRYRPSLAYTADREPDKTDFNHDVDLVINQEFTPRVTLSVVDTFRRGELPELENKGVQIREEDDFIYNSLNGTLGYQFRPQTRLEVAGRYILLRYDEDIVADTEDYDLYVGGITLRHQFIPETVVLLDLRMEGVEYEGPDRGSKSLFVGGGVEQVFSPNFLGSARGGYQGKEFNEEALGDTSSPYGDISLTFLPSPATRITAGAGYSMFEADVYPFANQDRTLGFVSIAYDVTARISAYLTGSYSQGDYSADQSVDPTLVTDGDEDTLLVSARLTYQINRINWVEAGWQYTDFSSNIKNAAGDKYRVSYDRNRISIGWKIQL